MLLSGCLVAAGLALRSGLGSGLVEMARDWSIASATIPLSSGGVGALIVSRRPRNLVGWGLVMAGLGTALAGAARHYATYGLSGQTELPGVAWVVWAFTWLIELNLWLLVVVVLIFPYDRPRGRARSVLVGFALTVGAFGALVAALTPFGSANQGSPFAGVSSPVPTLPGETAELLQLVYYEALLLAAYVVPLVVMLISVWRARGLERQQWKMFGIGVLGFASILVAAAVNQDLIGVAAIIGLPAIPVAIGLAILRFRLYDIDRLLTRSLSYALITGVLVAAYVVAVVALRAALSPVTGESDVSVAGSTLLVAGLFGPVRRHVQQLVDRRFSRRRCDAALAVEAFAGRLRREVVLDEVSSDLQRTIASTLQPTSVSLWLGDTEGRP